MIKVLLVLLISFLGVKNSSAQYLNYDFAKVDSLAISMPDTFASQDILTQHLTENYDSELMKTRAIYYWIINNIDYDDKFEERKNVYYFEYEADFVFLIKRATCVGYSALFEDMCKSAGIKCYPVGGYIKGHQLPEGMYPYSTHQWNVININDEWYHIDLTWDASNLKESKDSLQFIISTDELIETRLPSNPMWQFTKTPISINEFVNDPMLLSKDSKLSEYNYVDSIEHFESSSPIERRLFDERQTMTFNPMYSFDYGMTLYEKADSISQRPYETTQASIRNFQLARTYYIESLKYLNPAVPIYLADDEVIFFHDKRVKEIIKKIQKSIKFIDKMYKSFSHYID